MSQSAERSVSSVAEPGGLSYTGILRRGAKASLTHTVPVSFGKMTGSFYKFKTPIP